MSLCQVASQPPHYTGEGFNVMSVSVFYGWLDFLKYLMDVREFKPNGQCTCIYYQSISAIIPDV